MSNRENAAVFVGMLLNASTAAHFLHLSTKSYAEHKALGSFYDDILDLADTWAEAYQGHYGVIPLELYPDGFKIQRNAKQFLMALQSAVKSIRQQLPDDTDLQNIIDEIVALIATTLYKVENLK